MYNFADMPGFQQFAPEEEIPEVPVELDRSKAHRKDGESDGNK